ncbi:formate dehydrogenase alpha subunit [Desulfomicrobium norvegicum]|uniref:nitrate reductase (cytochrome) n=1 Tax=Desulfomicrobium norvegicum (strain DSM 1741 / NCIMB 8310) TaxID=52561 RepID=A0A8G2C4S3_DESNO|nr:formate dehydrogenase subunit alpha [Desulfomicrobium norvegicum]SFM01578.1 formate dehydrogenase alpha subunit [Desulfomicrobium norvegicum]
MELTINDITCTFTPGQTILEVATAHGIFIPTLCHLPNCTPTGACRICVVEVRGARTLVASCAAPAAEGMIVGTDSDRVLRARKTILRLMLDSGNHDCLLCPAAGDCVLQSLAFRYGVGTGTFGRPKPRHRPETGNPFIVRDFSKCILCGRCVQACNEVQVNEAIDYGYRGAATKIVAGCDSTLGESDCVFCGECLQVCPVGALSIHDARGKARLCETRPVRTTCPYCGVGCQMDVHVKDGRIQHVLGAMDGHNEGSLCVKGRFALDFTAHPERLRAPLIRRDGELVPAGWDEALDLVASRLLALREEHGPRSLGFLASARCTNEENYLFQKLARCMGTNNVDHCARLCHASSLEALVQAFGSASPTNVMADVVNAEVILVTGSNTTETHPVFSSRIKRAARSGATLVVADPREIGLTRHADLWLRPRPGTDIAWINGLMHVILSEGLENRDFIDRRTEGSEELREALAVYTPAYVQTATGIPAADLVRAARLYARAGAATILYCMGITQHTCGTDTVLALANLAMLCGQVGRPGAGINPLRGQNNVQGSCDMGGLPGVLPGYGRVDDDAALGRIEGLWKMSLSKTPGLTATEMFASPELRAMYIMGENPALSDADASHAQARLAALDFLVVQDIFLTETARLADVVLPAASALEKDGTFTNTDRRVQRVRAAVPCPGEALPDWRILNLLGPRLGVPMGYDRPEEIMREIALAAPIYGGIDYRRIRREGIVWPCPDQAHPGTPILHRETFPRGLGRFIPTHPQAPAEVPDEMYPFVLGTGRVLEHYHTGTMTRKSEGLNRIVPECFVEMNQEDAARLGIAHGRRVRVASRRGEISVRAEVTDRVARGHLFIPFHFAEAAANVLTNPALDPLARIPEFKVCAVRVIPE